MDGGAASRSGASQEPEGWAGAQPAAISDLERSRKGLEQITRQAQARRSVESGDAEHVRSLVYWHLTLLASILRPISDGVRISPPRKIEDVERVERATRPILADIVGLFGVEQNIMYFVDDDDAYTTTEQIKQVVELQESLSASMADYLDVVEGIDRGGTRRSKVRKEFMTTFRQLQNKIDLIVEELQTWRR
jgi:hypothetical protein